MKNKSFITILLIFFLSSTLFAQFNEKEFLYRCKTIYHSLRLSGLDNFSSWVTSNIFLEATKDISDEEIYPVEIIWKNPDLIYYIKRPLPQVENDEKQKEIQELQLDMIKVLQGLLIDWQRFSAGNILDDIPETYLISTKKDTVFLEYEHIENGKNVKVKMLFGMNGICLKIITYFSQKNEVMYIYPVYILVENKWICNKWTVQIYQNGQVESGFQVSVKSRKLDNYWIPERLILQLQKRGMDDILYFREYIFKNVVLNKDLQILK
jgi:hypothetical protein